MMASGSMVQARRSSTYSTHSTHTILSPPISRSRDVNEDLEAPSPTLSGAILNHGEELGNITESFMRDSPLAESSGFGYPPASPTSGPPKSLSGSGEPGEGRVLGRYGSILRSRVARCSVATQTEEGGPGASVPGESSGGKVGGRLGITGRRGHHSLAPPPSAKTSTVGTAMSPPPGRPDTAPPTILLARSSIAPVLVRRGEDPNSVIQAHVQRSDSSELLHSRSPTPSTSHGAVGTMGRAPGTGEDVSGGGLMASGRSMMSATDPLVIQAITHTMIGEEVWKYTRGGRVRRHRRFFWIHPYTKTLYWSRSAPGTDAKTARRSEARAKSASILSVRVILERASTEDTGTGGEEMGGAEALSNYSLLITTPSRELRVRATSDEKHAIWLRALGFLQSRPKTPATGTPGSSSPADQRNGRRLGAPPETSRPSTAKVSTVVGGIGMVPGGVSAPGTSHLHPGNSTFPAMRQPTARTVSGMVSGQGTEVIKQKRSLSSLFQRMGGPEASRSVEGGEEGRKEGSTSRAIPAGPLDPSQGADTIGRLSLGLNGDEGNVREDEEDDDDTEELANVRACCDGKHDVGKFLSGGDETPMA